jgi:hypothetical protein
MKEAQKAVVSVTDMARMCELSRQRFYQLVGTVFPWPLYSVATRRPFYPEDLQQLCLQFKKTHRGIDGKPVLFYGTSRNRKAKKIRCSTGTANGNSREELALLVHAIRELGFSATESQVEAAVMALYPSGIDDADTGEVIRIVFLHLKQQESVDGPGK